MIVNEQPKGRGIPDPDVALPSQEGEGTILQDASTATPTPQPESGPQERAAATLHSQDPLTAEARSSHIEEIISEPILEAPFSSRELRNGAAPVSKAPDGGEMNDLDALTAILAVGQITTNTNGYEVSALAGEPQIQNIQAPELDETDLPSVPLYPSQSSITDIAFLDSAGSVADSEVPRIQAFAKLEFDDGQFYMNTYSVELGRDIRAARAAFQQGFDSSHSLNHRHKRSSSSGDANQAPRRLRHGGSRNMESSVVSETGGIIGVDVSEEERKKKLYKKKTKSTSSSSHYPSRKNSTLIAGFQTDYQSLAMASLADPHGIDALTFLPSPEECPLIPIHPPAVAEGSNTGHRGISRRHIRIAYNFERRLFEMEVLGKNGAFMDEQHYAPGEIQELKSGSYIQIGGVGVRFVLPDVAIGETGAEGAHGPESIVGSAMSFDFEDGRGESITMADSVEPTTSDDEDSLRGYNREAEKPLRNRKLPDPESSSSDDEDEEEEDNDEDEDEDDEASDEQEEHVDNRPKRQTLRLTKPAKPAHEPKGRGKSKPKPEPVPEMPAQPPKRKGPGRPPKNGIISKREQALLARQAREAAKAEALKNGLIKPGKTAKPDKPTDTIPPPDAKPEKRKYTKRKSKAEGQPTEQTQAQEATDKADSIPPAQVLPEQPPKPVKEKRPPKPPRSPSPVFDEATLTPEQLAKPSQSYVVLIHEALTNSKTGAMSLPQIYRAIERRYPYYKLRVTTTGWQSSVRHNLSQHPAFRKIERDGKGWMWGLVPEISIEKEKKRRPSPPPMPPQQYYQQGGPHMYRHPYPFPGMPPPPNGHLPPMNHPYGVSSGMPPPPPGYPLNHVGLPRGINGIPLPLAPQREAASTYQSPYQPPPPSQQAGPQPTPLQQQPPSSGNTNGAVETKSGSQQPLPSPSYQHPNAPATSAPPQPPPEPSLPSSTEQANPMGQPILEMVGIFKKVLIASLVDLPHAEQVVTNAINRTLGIAPPANVVVKEYPEEAVIMKTLANLLETAISKERAQRQASQAASSPSTSQLAVSSVSPLVPVQSEPPPTTGTEDQPPASVANQAPSAVENPPSTFTPHNAETQNKLLALLQQLGPSSTANPTSMPLADKTETPADTEAAANGHTSKPPSSEETLKATENELRAKSLKRGLEDDTSSDGSGTREKPQVKKVASGA